MRKAPVSIQVHISQFIGVARSVNKEHLVIVNVYAEGDGAWGNKCKNCTSSPRGSRK